MADWKRALLTVLGCVMAMGVFVVGLAMVRHSRSAPPSNEVTFRIPPPGKPLRPIPSRFPPNTHMPTAGEGNTSGSIDLGTFSAGRDLIHIDDERVWWESDNDNGDEEDDHTIHWAVEAPLRRLIELVAARGGTLKVQEAYRASGIHNPRSLHREGRAIDVTCDEMTLEELAALCWAAGFDWVYHEANARLGAHVHCSVSRSR